MCHYEISSTWFYKAFNSLQLQPVLSDIFFLDTDIEW